MTRRDLFKLVAAAVVAPIVPKPAPVYDWRFYLSPPITLTAADFADDPVILTATHEFWRNRHEADDHSWDAFQDALRNLHTTDGGR